MSADAEKYRSSLADAPSLSEMVTTSVHAVAAPHWMEAATTRIVATTTPNEGGASAAKRRTAAVFLQGKPSFVRFIPPPPSLPSPSIHLSPPYARPMPADVGHPDVDVDIRTFDKCDINVGKILGKDNIFNIFDF